MARISTYALDDTLEQDDKIIGTDTSSANATMNFSLQQLGEFFTRTGLADSSTVFTFDVATQAYGTGQTPTTIEDGTIYFNLDSAAGLTEIIIPIETNTGVVTLPFINAIANETIILNQAGAGRGLHYGFYDVGEPAAPALRDVVILNETRGYRIPVLLHRAGATTTGLPTGNAVVTPVGIAGTSADLTTRLLTDLSNVNVDATEALAFRTAIGAGGTNTFDGSFTSLTSLPTTISGYGITDASISGRTISIGGTDITVPGTAGQVGIVTLAGHDVTELDDVTNAGSGQIITADERTAIDDNTTNLSDHEADVANPHSVTAAQVGLGNVDNTSDANKPVSAATTTALGLKANTTALHPAASKGSNGTTGNVVTDITVDVNTQAITPTYGTITQTGGGTSHAVFTPRITGNATQVVAANGINTFALSLQSETGFTYEWDAGQTQVSLGLPTGWNVAISVNGRILSITTPAGTTATVNQSVTLSATSTHTVDDTTAVHSIPVTLTTFRDYFFGTETSEPTAFITPNRYTDVRQVLTSGTRLTFQPTADGTLTYAIVAIHSSFGTPTFEANGFLITADTHTDPGGSGYTEYVIPFRRTLRLEII